MVRRLRREGTRSRATATGTRRLPPDAADSATTSAGAKQRLEDLVGDAVIGYRAPNFSIGAGQTWAY